MEAGKRVVDSPIHLADFGGRHLQIQSDILCGITLAARSCDMKTFPRKKKNKLFPSLLRSCSNKCRISPTSGSAGVYKCNKHILQTDCHGMIT